MNSTVLAPIIDALEQQPHLEKCQKQLRFIEFCAIAYNKYIQNFDGSRSDRSHLGQIEQRRKHSVFQGHLVLFPAKTLAASVVNSCPMSVANNTSHIQKIKELAQTSQFFLKSIYNSPKYVFLGFKLRVVLLFVYSYPFI